MYQRQVSEFRARRTQQFHGAVADTAAAVCGDAAGLVDDEQPLVLENDAPFDRGDLPFGRFARPRAESGRRDTHFVPGLQPVFGPHPAAIHAHLPLAQNAIEPAFRQARQLPAKEIVDTLTSLF
jgi:hypothetical protein